MKSLYNEDHRYNPEAEDLSYETIESIKPIFKKYQNMGFSPREIAHIMM